MSEGVSISGNDLLFKGDVRVVNYGGNTAYLLLTPSGGTGSIPFLAQGLPGKPPIFDSITVEEVNPGDTLPTPNPVVTMVSPGGDGQASHYTMKFYIHKGATGATGANQISTAVDLAASPTLGSGTDKFVLTYRHSDGKWVPTAQLAGNQYVPAVISSTAFNNASPRLIAQVDIPAQPFAWRPRVFAQTAVTGSSATRVDLVARLDNAATGDQVGFAKGSAGATPPTLVMIPASPAGSSIPGTYGRVNAGSAATVYLRAEQKAPTSGSWSTPGDPDTTFWVEVAPLL